MKKRILSIMLVVCMAITMMPTSSLANDTIEVEDRVYNQANDVSMMSETENSKISCTFTVLDQEGEIIGSEEGYHVNLVDLETYDSLPYLTFTSGTISIELEYNENNKIVYENKEYDEVLVWGDLPEGYEDYFGSDFISYSYVLEDLFYNSSKYINVINIAKDLQTEIVNHSVTYRILTRKGELVEDAEITISLCNDSGSDEEIVIAQSSSGKVDYCVSCTDNRYVYNEKTYAYIKVNYKLSEGYENSSGNTSDSRLYWVEDGITDTNLYVIDLSNEDEPHPDGITIAETEEYRVAEYMDEDGWYSYRIFFNMSATEDIIVEALTYVPEYARTLEIIMFNANSIHISDTVLQLLETREIGILEWVDDSGAIVAPVYVNGADKFEAGEMILQIEKYENQELVNQLHELGVDSNYTCELYNINPNINLGVLAALPIHGVEKDDSVEVQVYYYNEDEKVFSLIENLDVQYVEVNEIDIMSMYAIIPPIDSSRFGTYAICYNNTLENTQGTISYNIAFNANGATSGSMSSLKNCVYDVAYKLSNNAFKKTGYTFTGWNTKADGTGTAYSNGASVKNLTSTNGTTVTLYAQWKKDTYTITYELNGGRNNNSNPTNYDITSLITLQNPTRTGYTFAGWYSDKNLTNKVTAIAKGSSGNKTFYAKWIPNNYSIKFDGNGATTGKMSVMSNKQYDTSFQLTSNVYKRKGYTFTGWNTQKDRKGISYTDKESVKNLTSENGKEVTLYAQWKKTKYTITYKLNGGKNSKSNKSSYYVTTSTFKLKNPTRKGYTFKGWYSDKKCTKKVTKITKGTTGNKTYYAKWVKTKYKITYNLNKGKNNKNNKKTYYVTTKTFKLKNPTRKGYVFKGWYSDKKCTKKVTKIKKGSTGNVKLYAKWVKK